MNEILLELWNDPNVQNRIIELNTEEQLKLGIRSDGKFMPPYRNKRYLSAKRQVYGQTPFDRINLRLRGEFYDTWKVFGTLVALFIDAKTMIHGRDFIDEYGLEILGLTDENLQKLIEFIKPLIIEKFINKAFMGID